MCLIKIRSESLVLCGIDGGTNVQTVVVGAREKLVSVDVPLTTAFCVATTVSAYTVSPSACTLRDATPATLAIAPVMGSVNCGRELVAVVGTRE